MCTSSCEKKKYFKQNARNIKNHFSTMHIKMVVKIHYGFCHSHDKFHLVTTCYINLRIFFIIKIFDLTLYNKLIEKQKRL